MILLQAIREKSCGCLGAASFLFPLCLHSLTRRSQRRGKLSSKGKSPCLHPGPVWATTATSHLFQLQASCAVCQTREGDVRGLLQTLSSSYCAVRAHLVCCVRRDTGASLRDAEPLQHPPLPSSSDRWNQAFRAISSTNENCPAKWLPVNSQCLNKDIGNKM